MDPRVLSKTLGLHPEVTLAGTKRKQIVRRKELMNPTTSHMSKLVDWMREYGIDKSHRWPKKD